jgi:hypothetical protein
MLGSITDQRVFEDLVAEHLPQLAEHFGRLDLQLALISFPWLLCLFIGHVPLQVALLLLLLILLFRKPSSAVALND